MIPHVDPAQFAAASGAEREALAAHIVSCTACRRRVAEHDPALLFGLLAVRPIPPAALDEVSRGVSRNLPSQRTSWIEAVQLRGASRTAAAAAVLAAALITGSIVFRNASRPVSQPAAMAAVPTVAVSSVESLRPARVVDLTVGETQVVMIFDPEMKL